MRGTETVWPTNRTPPREQIERLYRLAYLVEPAVFSPEDAVAFGLDVRRLKEFGQVRMTKPLVQLRRRLPDFWARLRPRVRAIFIASYMVERLPPLDAMAEELQRETGEGGEIKMALGLIRSTLFGVFPREIDRKLREGLGKWGNGGGR